MAGRIIDPLLEDVKRQAKNSALRFTGGQVVKPARLFETEQPQGTEAGNGAGRKSFDEIAGSVLGNSYGRFTAAQQAKATNSKTNPYGLSGGTQAQAKQGSVSTQANSYTYALPVSSTAPAPKFKPLPKTPNMKTMEQIRAEVVQKYNSRPDVIQDVRRQQVAIAQDAYKEKAALEERRRQADKWQSQQQAAYSHGAEQEKAVAQAQNSMVPAHAQAEYDKFTAQNADALRNTEKAEAVKRYEDKQKELARAEIIKQMAVDDEEYYKKWKAQKNNDPQFEGYRFNDEMTQAEKMIEFARVEGFKDRLKAEEAQKTAMTDEEHYQAWRAAKIAGPEAEKQRFDEMTQQEKVKEIQRGEEYLKRFNAELDIQKLEDPTVSGIEKGLIRTAAGVDNIGTNLVGEPLYFLETAAQNAANLFTGNNDAVDNNSVGSKMIREANLANEVALHGTSGVSKFAGESALSIGNFLANVITRGPFAALGMGLSAAGRAAYNIGERGGSGSQQLIGGAISGGAEYIGERFAFKGLAKIADTPITAWTAKQVVKTVGAQMATEFGEEAATEVMNILGDMAVMGSKAELAEYFNGYLEANPGPTGKAIALTATEAAKQILYAGAQGAVSGGVLGGAATGYNAIANRSNTTNSTFDNNIENGPNGPIAQEAPAAPPEAHAFAVQDVESARAEAEQLRNDAITVEQQAGLTDFETAYVEKMLDGTIDPTVALPPELNTKGIDDVFKARFFAQQGAEQYAALQNALNNQSNAAAGTAQPEETGTAQSGNTAYERNTVPPVNDDIASIMQARQNVKQARKEADRVLRKTLLTDNERGYVDGMLAGYNNPTAGMPPEYNQENVWRVYEAKKAVQDAEAPIKAFNARRIEQLHTDAMNSIANSIHWKDKKSGLRYQTETWERTMFDMMPSDEEAVRMTREYFTPVHQNEASATRMKNEIRQQIRELNLNEHESVYLQIAGELQGVEQARDLNLGRTDAEYEGLVQYAKDYYEKFGSKIDLDKIDRAIPVFRQIYDSLFEQVNNVYVANGYAPIEYRQGYWPHFTDTEGDGLLTKIASAFGLNGAPDALPTDVIGMTHNFTPGRRWNPNALERTGFKTGYNALQGMDKYLEVSADIIHHTEDIKRLRALERAVRESYSDETVREKLKEVRNNQSISEDERQRQIEEMEGVSSGHLGNFVVNLNEYTNQLAGKKALADRPMEQTFTRKAYNVMRKVESRIAANMVAMNLTSAATNVIPIVRASAEVSAPNLARGMKDTVENNWKSDGIVNQSAFLTNRGGSDALYMTAAERAAHKIGDVLGVADQFAAGTVVRGRYYDNIDNGMSHAEAIREADDFAASIIADRSKGALPVIFNAKNPFYKLFTMFQVEVNNDFRSLFKDLPRRMKDKGAGALALALTKFLIGKYLFNDLFEWIFGRDVGFDPLGLANDSVGHFSGYKLPNVFDAAMDIATGKQVDFTTPKQNLGGAVLKTGADIAGQLPFAGPLASGLMGKEYAGRYPVQAAFPDLPKLANGAFGLMNGTVPVNKGWADVYDGLKGPVSYLLPPFGGGQIKKTGEGLYALAQGGSYAIDSEGNKKLRFALEDLNPAQKMQVALFGPYASRAARDYVEGGFKVKSVKYTDNYQRALAAGIPGDVFRDWWDTQSNIRADKNAKGNAIPGSRRQKLIDAVDALPLSVEEKMLLLAGAGVED